MSALASNTQALFNPGAVVHVRLLDTDNTWLARVVYADTIGLAVVLSPYESWAEYARAAREGDLEVLPLEDATPRFYPWHTVEEVVRLAGRDDYRYWLQEQQNTQAVAA